MHYRKVFVLFMIVSAHISIECGETHETPAQETQKAQDNQKNFFTEVVALVGTALHNAPALIQEVGSVVTEVAEVRSDFNELDRSLVLQHQNLHADKE